MDWGADPGADVAVRELDPLSDAVEAAVAGLQGSDPAGLGASALAERIVRIEALLARLGAHQLACIDVFDQGGVAQAMGAGSTAAWLREHARLGPGAASARVGLARRMAEHPATAAALADARISVRHAQVVTRTIAEVGPRLATMCRWPSWSRTCWRWPWWPIRCGWRMRVPGCAIRWRRNWRWTPSTSRTRPGGWRSRALWMGWSPWTGCWTRSAGRACSPPCTPAPP